MDNLNLEFNCDGSLKVPNGFVKKLVDSDEVFKDDKAIRIVKKMVSCVNPLKCELLISCSNKFEEVGVVEKLFRSATGKFRHMAQLSFNKVNSYEFKVSIVSGQYRCSWCENFINYLGEKTDCKIIDETSCMSFSK